MYACMHVLYKYIYIYISKLDQLFNMLVLVGVRMCIYTYLYILTYDAQLTTY